MGDFTRGRPSLNTNESRTRAVIGRAELSDDALRAQEFYREENGVIWPFLLDFLRKYYFLSDLKKIFVNLKSFHIEKYS